MKVDVAAPASQTERANQHLQAPNKEKGKSSKLRRENQPCGNLQTQAKAIESKQQNKQAPRRTKKAIYEIERKSETSSSQKEETNLEVALQVRYSNLGRRKKLTGERWGTDRGFPRTTEAVRRLKLQCLSVQGRDQIRISKTCNKEKREVLKTKLRKTVLQKICRWANREGQMLPNANNETNESKGRACSLLQLRERQKELRRKVEGD